MLKNHELLTAFHQVYREATNLNAYFAPGRVNLIGEHIDYSGGHVFPCAIEQGTYLLIKLRGDQRVQGYSDKFADQGIFRSDLRDTGFQEERGWFNYLVGIVDFLKKQGVSFPHGFDCFITGTIPEGAGLSSSASLELATAYAINELYSLRLERKELALLAHRVENEYIGVRCGYMDQFAVALGKGGHGLLLDCRNLNHEHVPLCFDNVALVIVDSRQKRSLANSAYNERRNTCEEALALLRLHHDLDFLCDIGVKELRHMQHLLKDPVILRRVRHAVTENARVMEAVAELRSGNLRQLGHLMKESHRSLQVDYEVSTPQLDLLAALAWKHEACIGARMTGAGFGGCTVNLVVENEIDAFINYLAEQYHLETGREFSHYVTAAADGVKAIPLV